MTLLQSLKKLFAPAPRTRAPAPRRRLGLESLEAREVLSASGLVSATANQSGQAVVFAIDRGDLWENNPQFLAVNGPRFRNPFSPDGQFPGVNDNVRAWSNLSALPGAPRGFTEISASRNERNQEVVFGRTAAGEVWEHNPSFGWHFVARADPADRGIAGISATRNTLGQAVVFIATGAGQVFEHNPALGANHLMVVTTPFTNTAWAATGRLAATQDAFNHPVVFVETRDINPNDGLNFDRAITEFRNLSGAWSTAAGARGVAYTTLSATQDRHFRPVLLALDSNRVLSLRHQDFQGGAFFQLSTGIRSVDATRNAAGDVAVFIVGANQTLEHLVLVPGVTNFRQFTNIGVSFSGHVAATQTGNGQEVAFAIQPVAGNRFAFAQNHLWELTPTGNGNWRQMTQWRERIPRPGRQFILGPTL